MTRKIVRGQPRAKLVNFSLLRGNNGLRRLSRPRILRMTESHARHIDGALVVRDHVRSKVHIRISRERRVHVAHHPRMGRSKFADGCAGSGSRVLEIGLERRA